MKRLLLYIAILGAAVWAPTERADVADLRPVETVLLCREDDAVVLKTDTEDSGRGRNALEALEDLKATTPGVIYLDTAQYLLLAEDVAEEVNALRAHLKETVTLYGFRGETDLKTVSKYLDVHGRGVKLKTWNVDTELPVLVCEDDRIILSKKLEKSA